VDGGCESVQKAAEARKRPFSTYSIDLGHAGLSRNAEMTTITFQVIEGVDKGRIFRDLPVPVTIGREEGNIVRLNDERVSRFHAKVQLDDADIILTDLESTNGTRVNGNVIQIRRLRVGDRITVGRSLLLFGSSEQIHARDMTLRGAARRVHSGPRPGHGAGP
jgi:pSer/pThr/pTyr-binding forkhead associated (FHA) protein